MAHCRCPSGARRVSTKPKGVRGAKARGPGFVCMVRDENAPRFVKKTRSGSCPKGAKKRSNKRGGSVCIGTVKSLRKAGRKVKPGYRFVKQVCPGGTHTAMRKRAKKRRKSRRR